MSGESIAFNSVLFISPVSVIFFLGSVSGDIHIGSSSQEGQRPSQQADLSVLLYLVLGERDPMGGLT
jgi:hypothetical protein